MERERRYALTFAENERLSSPGKSDTGLGITIEQEPLHRLVHRVKNTHGRRGIAGIVQRLIPLLGSIDRLGSTAYR